MRFEAVDIRDADDGGDILCRMHLALDKDRCQFQEPVAFLVTGAQEELLLSAGYRRGGTVWGLPVWVAHE